MTCRHAPGDPNCSSHPSHAYAEAEREKKRWEAADRATAQRHSEELAALRRNLAAVTPDAENFEVTDVARVGPHLVLKVKYPNCVKCSYEGTKILVLLNVTELEALKWRRIDPHFRDPEKSLQTKEAPSPAARFPASQEGWEDALAYAQSKVRQ